ncbi:uncharacterized protein BX663DRAFT_586171 [Cokeromyces recurvatus]|uniref:uncharacterized protein n=1 Tax=Cokeromyces recurvatus TaxID=90255 RepID=UPI00221EC2D6|nr:uncharacterized protein BX663DRAFT_586171 [Cokeromyces recurvatus]KAI7904579.1 hypothetical protein BX663DRAFT_586171 [Cokeromyces recurvatus]
MTINCPSRYKQYKIEQSETGVGKFFKEHNAIDWCLYNYSNFHRSVHQNIASKLKRKFHDDPEKIKKLQHVPIEIKKFIGELENDKNMKNIKKQKKEEGSTVNNFHNSTIGVAGENNGSVVLNNIARKRKAEEEVEEEEEEEKEDKVNSNGDDNVLVIDTSEDSINPALRPLYEHVYKVFQGKDVDISDIKRIYHGDTIQDKMYKFCYDSFPEYTSMTKKYQMKVSKKAFGHKSLKIDEVDVKQYIIKLKQVYLEDGIDGLRSEIVKQKYEIMSEKSFKDCIVNMKYLILEMMEIILNEVEFGVCKSNTNEINYLVYWKSIFSVAFRGANVILRIGETNSTGTKFDRMLNEMEFGETSAYVSGRKVDMIVETKTVNIKNVTITVELSNAEFKKMDVEDDFITIQQNKNIRTSKSILSNIFPLEGHNTVIGMNFVGLSGYFFNANFIDAAVFVNKVADVYLPGNDVDLMDFMDDCETILSIIFAYKKYMVNQAEEVNRKYQALRRRRLVASIEEKSENFPPTFYSPKR